MQVFAGHTAPVQCGEFTPDGKRIITADAEGTLIFWDPRNPAPLFKLTPSDARFALDGITALAVNPASTLAVVGGASGGVRVVSLSKGDVVGALGGHQEGESVEAVTFVELASVVPGATAASTGGVVVTGATDGKACIWDLSTMRLRATLQHEVCHSLCISLSSFQSMGFCRILSCFPCNTHDPASLRSLFCANFSILYMISFQDAVTSLLRLPAPKSHLVVSASADKMLRTWDARTGALLREHKGHHEPILQAALGLGGGVVVSAGDDGVCLVFPTE